MSEQNQVKEQAVLEPRHWVRITEACNNRCMFCLDSESLTGRHLPFDEVASRIREGFQPGARLILSGGEASIHPQFIDFVHLGKQTGYGWIQTVSNGRMWSSKTFCEQAIQAGLNEVTFSMHGHTPELHDELTGVPGGFKQALRGMLNLRAVPGMVVNVDICINGKNYKHLKEIIAFYERLGIHEFDLLQVVPFGRAFEEHQETMLYDVDEAFPYLNEAFHFAKKPNHYIWTNRFPPAYLEGIEDLIQDPHKLHDEVRGRSDAFKTWLDGGPALPCRQAERCRHCFLQAFCDWVEDQRALWQNPAEATGLRVDLTNRGLSEKTWTAILKHLPFETLTLRLFAEDYQQAEVWLERPFKAIHLKLQRYADLPQELPKKLTRLILHRESQLSLLERHPNTNWEFLLNKTFWNALQTRPERWTSLPRLVLSLVETETLSETQDLLPDLSSLARLNPGPGVTVEGIAPCFCITSKEEEAVLDTGVLDQKGRISQQAITDRYIRCAYRVKSVRCRGCVHHDTCTGMPINYIRHFGFRHLVPKTPTEGDGR